jgi:hypothetical protein
MKSLLTILVFLAFSGASFAASTPAKGRMLTDLNVIPTRVLQRSVSPKFYKSLTISPLEGLITVRASLSGTRLSGPKIIRSELSGLFDPLALQLAKEAQLSGNYTLENPHVTTSVLLHLLVYEIADGTMVLSFVHLDGPGGDQSEYYGCARLLVLKNDKWTEIRGPESLADKGTTVRRGPRNNYETTMKLERTQGAEATILGGGRR